MKPLNRALDIGLLACMLPLALHFKASPEIAFAQKYFTNTIPSNFIKDTVKFSAADSTVTDNDKHIVKLYGNAWITNKTTRVNADYIEYNAIEKTGTAKGNVILYEISENIIAKSSEAVFRIN